MIMIIHQRVSVASPNAFFDDVGEDVKEVVAVGVGAIDVFLFVATDGDVINGVFLIDA